MIKIFVRNTANLAETIRGLIGKRNPEALLLKTRFGIHTYGVKFPIDVLILDNENKVTVIKKNLKPNRIFLWNPKYEKVIELPAGTIEKEKIAINIPLDIRIL